MRPLLLLALAFVAACFPPSLRNGAAQLGSRFEAVGHRAVAAIAPVAPRVDVQVIANAGVDALGRRGLAAMPASRPVRLHRTIDASAPASPRAAAEPAVDVERVDAAPPTFFGMRYTKTDGSGACERFGTLAACNQACTSLAQQRGMTAQPDASCSCLEDAPSC